MNKSIEGSLFCATRLGDVGNLFVTDERGKTKSLSLWLIDQFKKWEDDDSVEMGRVRITVEVLGD